MENFDIPQPNTLFVTFDNENSVTTDWTGTVTGEPTSMVVTLFSQYSFTRDQISDWIKTQEFFLMGEGHQRKILRWIGRQNLMNQLRERLEATELSGTFDATREVRQDETDHVIQRSAFLNHIYWSPRDLEFFNLRRSDAENPLGDADNWTEFLYIKHQFWTDNSGLEGFSVGDLDPFWRGRPEVCATPTVGEVVSAWLFRRHYPGSHTI